MGKIIVFEGLDKSGKETQSKMLETRLKLLGKKAIRVEIPNYSSPTGIEIKASLYNQRDYTPREHQFLYTMNRMDMQVHLVLLLESYDFIILDRYTLSGLAYGSADGLDVSLIENLESTLIKPDLGFYIDIPSIISLQRKRPIDEPDDRYESDVNFLEKVRDRYFYYTRKYNYIQVDGRKSIEEVYETIVRRIKHLF